MEQRLKMKCPVCNGIPHYVEEDLGEGTIIWGDCSYCNRTGRISLGDWLNYQLYQYAPEWLTEWLIERYIKSHPAS